MKFTIVVFLSCFSILLIGQTSNKADQLLLDLVEEKKMVGVIAAYAIDGEVKWQNSAGYACRDEKIPFTDSTLTRIASIAKPMTAIAIMQLVEQGLIDLEQPIQTYLPEFPTKEKGTITTRHLLAHISGIPQYYDEKEIENKRFFPSLADAMTVFENRPLLFEPGSKFFYTTYGYVTLGRIIETVSGLSYEEYMQKNIFDKAGMKNTGVEKKAESYANKSCLYHKKRRRAKEGKQNDLSNRIPGGGFYSTLSDLISFGNALLEGKLIADTSFQQMIVNQFKEKEGNPYGLGWFLYGTPPNENVVIGHSGEQTGAATQIMLIPKSKTIVVVLSNTSRTWKEVVTYSTQLIQISEEK